MLGSADVMAFVATKDPQRSRDFYQNTLGLRLVADDSFAIIFDANGTMLRVQKVRELTPHPFTALGWQVPDIRAAIQGLAAKGVTFMQLGLPFLPQNELGIWTADDGTKVAWFKDPDGNTLSLTEF